MTTSQHLQLNLESLTSLQEDFPAKTYQLQVFKKVLPKKPDQVYFTNSSESYAWYDQNTLSWKTWQRSLIEGWTSFSGNFTKQGMMQNGQLYQQVLWEPVIKEADGGSLPTPTTMDHLPQRSVDSMIKQTRIHRKGRTKLANLREAVNPQTVELFNHLQTLPTPTARDHKDGCYNSTKNCKKQDTLGRKIHLVLPTPTAHEHKATGQDNPNQFGQMLSSIARRGELSEETGQDMFLNPAFVEEMMGYEVGWTDLKH
tara:strand:+ start:80 stop:847 length:768 start_codon:yes stop_codon:yes gene_type:complete